MENGNDKEGSRKIDVNGECVCTIDEFITANKDGMTRCELKWVRSTLVLMGRNETYTIDWLGTCGASVITILE